MANLWIIYDGRAASGDTDDASIFEACESRRDLKQALFNWRDYDAVLFEYDTNDSDPNDREAKNERMIGHLREGRQSLMAKCAGVTRS